MMKKLGLDASKVKIVPYDPAYTAFYNGEVEVTPCYSTGGLIKMRQKGLKLNLIWPSDYGIHFYSDTLVTTDRMISEKPDLVTRFLRASLKGWQDAIEDYRQAVTVTLKYAQIKDPRASDRDDGGHAAAGAHRRGPDRLDESRGMAGDVPDIVRTEAAGKTF